MLKERSCENITWQWSIGVLKEIALFELKEYVEKTEECKERVLGRNVTGGFTCRGIFLLDIFCSSL